MREKLWIYKFNKVARNKTQSQTHLWVKIDSELLDYWQREALEVIPDNSTAQKHYVQMSIVAMLLYQGNHSITYQNTYISSELFQSITNNYCEILEEHKSIIRTNKKGKPRYKNRFICGYRVEEPRIKQGKMISYQISGKSKLFETFCDSIFENLESKNGAMLCYKLEEVVGNMFNVSKRDFGSICKSIKDYKNKEQANNLIKLKELTKPIKFNINVTFEERYSYLYFSKELLEQNIMNKHMQTILSYLHQSPASHNLIDRYFDKEFNQNRYYHPFHRTPKYLREYVMFNGDKLVEAFDVKQCFYVLMCKLLETSDSIDNEELTKYEKLVRYGDLYTTIVNHIKDRVVEENNKGNGEWITYDSSKLWSQEKDVARNYIKKEIQRWRNMLPKRVEKDKGIIKGVDDFYLGFPTIRNFVLNYYTMVQKKKKNRCKVKQLQCDCIMIETKVMSHKVCKRLEEYGVYAITLHDGVYIRECDKELLHSINVSVENIFWEELNLLIDKPSLQQVV